MFIKDPYSLLAEAASMDLSVNTSVALTESQVNTIMESFDEVSEDVVYTAEMVSVVQVGGDYLVEMNALYPYMKSNNITSVAEALNNVAAVNGLQEKAVGLLIESDDRTAEMIQEACKKGGKAKEKALDRIKKGTEIPAKLKKEGFPVKKKKSKTAKDEACAKEGCTKESCNKGCSKGVVDEFKSDIKDQYAARDATQKMMSDHLYSKAMKDKDTKNGVRDALSGRTAAVGGKPARNMKDKLERDKDNYQDIKDANKYSPRNKSVTEAGEIFDFDLV